MADSLSRPGTSRDEVIAWVKRVIELTGWSSSHLAKEAGLAPSTLNKALKGSPHTLSSTTIGRIEAAADKRIRGRIAAGEIKVDELGPHEYIGGDRMVTLIERDSRGADQLDGWGFPEKWFRFRFQADPANCQVIPVEDDSMAPDMRPGDRVVVDLSITTPSPSGVFFIHDGVGLTPRRLEVVPGSNPTTVMVTAKNSDYLRHEVPLDGLKIAGRAVGMWRRL